MKEVILQKLREIECQFDVKILYACESGSRAWGFASPDSDFDVRFIYVQRIDHYLSIDEQRDVIELPVNAVLDINGWELRKALRLFRKSNAPVYEWLQSPIVYLENDAFSHEVRGFMSNYFSKRAAMHHYLSMAKGVIETELSGEKVKLKKYFYALRPLLAAQWIADKNEVPPMEFGRLRESLPSEINSLINDFLKKKMEVDETFRVQRNQELDVFIHERLKYCEAKVAVASSVGDSAPLSELLKRCVYDA